MMRTDERTGPELFIGLIGALGSPIEQVQTALVRGFERVGYSAEILRLTDGLRELGPEFEVKATNEPERIEGLMNLAGRLRSVAAHARPMAWVAASQLRLVRGAKPNDRRAYVFRSLKHRQEVAALRRIYGEHFIAIAVHSPRSERVESLARRFAEDGGRPDDHRATAERLVARDESEQGTKLGQDVRGAFPEADLFVSARTLDKDIDRFIDLYFGRPVVTPSRDELGMFHAHTASVRSGAMGRQVGAAIVTVDGDIVATGCNEVPKALGGQYWADDPDERRDYRLGADQSDRGKRMVLKELLTVLRAHEKLAADVDVDELVNAILSGGEQLPETAIANLTEFTRDVHAEGAALTTAARLGIGVRGCSLFATTFPCHNCAKHIVASGISRVVYREPYAKSYARDFYMDSIEVESERADRVSFVPFIGVAPRRFLDWFTMRKRKEEDGRVVDWSPLEAQPAFHPAGLDTGYIEREADVVDELADLVQSYRGQLAEEGGSTQP